VTGIRHLELSLLEQQRLSCGKSYLEVLRVPEASVGLYAIPAGGADPQKPHREAELYYVIRGKARMYTADGDRAVGPGSLLFVPPGMEHYFHSIEEELVTLVFFAPAETQL
jgi:mannose-6-phosphate isomerase-like protein (cupin superfamily)